MASTELITLLFPQLTKKNISRKEGLLLEIILFDYLCHELRCLHSEEINQWEDSMIDSSVIRGVINDLLLNQDYTIQGLARYTGYPEDAIYEVAAGINHDPTLSLSSKIIELHAVARRELYSDIVKRVFTKFCDEYNV